MFTKNSKEPIKTWSNQWMIDNEYHPPLVTNVDFTKTTAEKAELKVEKLHNKLAMKNPNYRDNQMHLMAEMAKSKPRFNILISTL